MALNISLMEQKLDSKLESLFDNVRHYPIIRRWCAHPTRKQSRNRKKQTNSMTVVSTIIMFNYNYISRQLLSTPPLNHHSNCPIASTTQSTRNSMLSIHLYISVDWHSQLRPQRKTNWQILVQVQEYTSSDDQIVKEPLRCEQKRPIKRFYSEYIISEVNEYKYIIGYTILL
jgi:hypothetical protein